MLLIQKHIVHMAVRWLSMWHELSSVTGAHVAGKRRNWLLSISVWCPHVYCGMHAPHIMHAQTTIIIFWKRHPVSVSDLHTHFHMQQCVQTHTVTHTTHTYHTNTYIIIYIHYVTKEQVINLILGKIIRKYTFWIRSMNGHITYDISYYNDSTYLSVKVI